ncbi:hypothetical protein Cni_G18482 [Canna indica]|uniref:Late embryogenesis abundant protein LEA-2 subgroup domain-containing protein n=1 Tax=Canna indica TaxID=4628 RepID=A0AAQ3KJ84_9LILI|nr:hypothetical protein Cni_G18482 [Canna indica]
MHAKTDSEVTSLAASSPPRSPPRRPVYYVMSPTHSHPDGDRVSFGGSSPGASPLNPHYHHPHHHRYASSPIHHSRESSTTRLSASVNLKYNFSWRKLQSHHHLHPGAAASSGCSDSEDDDGSPVPVRCYVVWFVLGFVLLFTLFSLILWGASKSYKPRILVKGVFFQSYDIHAGTDITGVPTKMLSINSTVKIAFRNPATFFGIHVSSTPLDIYYSELKIATGNMKEFYQSRKSSRTVVVVVAGRQVPLYGGGVGLRSRTEDGGGPAVVPLELHFTVRARAYVLGHLVKSKFYRRVRCSMTLREERIGKPLHLSDSCKYHV